MKKIRILIVDSWSVNLALFENFFLEYAEVVEIKTAADCISGWEIYNSFQPDLIVIEPYGISGFSFLEKIREREISQSIKTVVIAVTSQDMVGDREIHLLAGFDSYISRPVVFKEFRKEIFKLVPQLRILVERAENKTIPCRILTVTADPLMSAFLVKPLEQNYPGGATVDITENSNETMNFLHKHFSEKKENNGGIDVVLLDLDLPGRKNGPNAYQLSMLIKAKYPEVVTAGLTTFFMLDSKKKCLDSGMDFLFDVGGPNKVLAREIIRALYQV